VVREVGTPNAKSNVLRSVSRHADGVPFGLHFVRSYHLVHHPGGKEILARLAGRRCKQRRRLRDCASHLAIWLRARESVLYCAVFLQRVALAQAIAYG